MPHDDRSRSTTETRDDDVQQAKALVKIVKWGAKHAPALTAILVFSGFHISDTGTVATKQDLANMELRMTTSINKVDSKVEALARHDGVIITARAGDLIDLNVPITANTP